MELDEKKIKQTFDGIKEITYDDYLKYKERCDTERLDMKISKEDKKQNIRLVVLFVCVTIITQIVKYFFGG